MWLRKLRATCVVCLMIRLEPLVRGTVTFMVGAVWMAGHYVSMVLASRVVSGVSSTASRENSSRRRRMRHSSLSLSSRRRCSLTPQAVLISSVGFLGGQGRLQPGSLPLAEVLVAGQEQVPVDPGFPLRGAPAAQPLSG